MRKSIVFLYLTSMFFTEQLLASKKSKQKFVTIKELPPEKLYEIAEKFEKENEGAEQKYVVKYEKVPKKQKKVSKSKGQLQRENVQSIKALDSKLGRPQDVKKIASDYEKQDKAIKALYHSLFSR